MSNSAFGKIREGLSELADTAKEKVTAGLEGVVEAAGDVKEKAAEKANEAQEAGSGFFNRIKKAAKAFKE